MSEDEIEVDLEDDVYETTTTEKDYEELENKPQINGVELVGNKSLEDLGITDTTYDVATTEKDGLMSASDKEKLDGIEDNSSDYELPIATSDDLGGVKISSGLSIDEEGNLSIDEDYIEETINENFYTKTEIDELIGNELSELEEI